MLEGKADECVAKVVQADKVTVAVESQRAHGGVDGAEHIRPGARLRAVDSDRSKIT